MGVLAHVSAHSTPLRQCPRRHQEDRTLAKYWHSMWSWVAQFVESMPQIPWRGAEDYQTVLNHAMRTRLIDTAVTMLESEYREHIRERVMSAQQVRVCLCVSKCDTAPV